MKPLEDISNTTIFLRFRDIAKLVFFKQQHAMHPLNVRDVMRDDYREARRKFATAYANDRMREDFGLVYCRETQGFVNIASIDSEPDPS